MTHKNARQLLAEVAELLKELEVYSGQRDALFASLRKLGRDYEDGRFGYLEFQEKQKALLRGRTREELSGYYSAYIYSLLKKVEFIISQATALVYDDNSFSSLAVKGKGKASVFTAPKGAASPAASVATAEKGEAGRIEVFNIDNEIGRLKRLLEAKNISPLQLGQLQDSAAKSGRLGRLREGIPAFEEVVKEIEAGERRAAKEGKAKFGISPRQVKQPIQFAAAEVVKSRAHLLQSLASAAKAAIKFAIDVPVTAARSLGRVAGKMGSRKPAAAKSPSEFYAPKKEPSPAGAQRQGVFSALAGMLNPNKVKKGIFVEEIVQMERQAKAGEKTPLAEQKEPAGLAFGWFSVKGLVGELTEKFRSKQEPILGEKTAIPVHVKKLKEMRRKLYEEERLSGFDTTLLAQEARRVKKILEVEKPEVYQGSSVGLIANLTVRKISLFLVDTFPEFFGFLYNALRAANVKVLSNTYVNIMILATLFVIFSSFFLLLALLFIFGYPIYQIVLRAAILSVIAGFSCATIFYAYPFLKIKERRRNIMTNMPFGINHMAAVATSGVPPVSMFELISASKEYGEIGIEVKKVVDFINIFGYDLLTAIRTVAATTPSQPFKEFLEGMVSTIETGGDLDSYLRQEADQAALTYNLERQRYNETVSTYSDIYTGLLIAAPLFFIAAMALVNLLGGSLGGIGVDVVMAVGAYLVIPLLNVGFLMFLQITQPDV
ncbi:type II secretion system F family protein [Candidatus Woesearchaeota archaeon]|nr:type II secretion system F family protein [Candidatus Woesearchaeota archaeon]